jgi:hypothetical protein
VSLTGRHPHTPTCNTTSAVTTNRRGSIITGGAQGNSNSSTHHSHRRANSSREALGVVKARAREVVGLEQGRMAPGGRVQVDKEAHGSASSQAAGSINSRLQLRRLLSVLGLQ